MPQTSTTHATNRRALLAFTSMLAALVMSVALVVLLLQRERLHDAELEDLSSEMQLLGELASDALLKSDYDAVERLIDLWLVRHDYLSAIRAVAPNGFVLADKRKAAPVDTPLMVNRDVVFDGRTRLTLHAVGDFAAQRRDFAAAVLQVAVAAVALILLLSGVLWLTLKRTALQPLAREIGRREANERELRQRNVDLQNAIDQAEHASRAKSEFLSHMSHELRTPLNAILGFAQISRMQGPDVPAEQRAQHMEQIEKAGWHLLALINEVLDLSRIESGTMFISREPVELRALCAECLRLVAPLASSADIDLVDATAGSEPVFALADRTRLAQVLMNLLSNALKYNRRSGSVVLTLATPTEDNVELSVADTGPGFSAEQLRQLYQPFNRLGAERGAIEGAGIGLVITKRLTELMGGTLSLATQAGAGACFTLRLTRTQPAPAQDGPVRPAPPPTAPSSGAGLTVLYIEDNPANVELIRSALALRPGARLVAVPDGLAGLTKAGLERPDLIVVDIALPGIDGYEVCRRLRAQADTAAKPIIALSANAMQVDIERGLRAGFDAYLTKPLAVEVFLAQVDRLLSVRG